eukprot:gnl/Dysnectes_brevis/8757_a15801_191.p1 GENE.gnl/Dysnectes_brevis/8757_a15801_191~~gnl/Dysnectes_brevis/8757_a15801_191.p1  ORF type:complete len:214 (-),score=57.67 gnl/Dysnectes_brevis/8757_a15801_191:32-673(-)
MLEVILIGSSQCGKSAIRSRIHQLAGKTKRGFLPSTKPTRGVEVDVVSLTRKVILRHIPGDTDIAIRDTKFRLREIGGDFTSLCSHYLVGASDAVLVVICVDPTDASHGSWAEGLCIMKEVLQHPTPPRILVCLTRPAALPAELHGTMELEGLRAGGASPSLVTVDAVSGRGIGQLLTHIIAPSPAPEPRRTGMPAVLRLGRELREVVPFEDK